MKRQNRVLNAMILDSNHNKSVLFHLLLVSFSLAPFLVFSQTDSIKDKTELYDIYFSPGSSTFPVFAMSQENFKKIVPTSQILSGDMMKVNFNDFGNDSAGGFYNGVGKNAFYAQLGVTLKLKNREFFNAGPWVKLGLNYFASSTLLNTGVFKNNTLSVDSVYFVNGLPVNSTTLNARSVIYEYNCQSINLEGTLVYRLNPKGIFSLFGGPGALLGLSFDGTAKIVETVEKTTNDYLLVKGTGNVVYKNDKEKKVNREEFSLPPNLCFGVFINVGIDLRLGSNYDIIKNTHLFAEMKPMFRSYALKGAGLQASGILVGNVGLRYQLL